MIILTIYLILSYLLGLIITVSYIKDMWGVAGVNLLRSKQTWWVSSYETLNRKRRHNILKAVLFFPLYPIVLPFKVLWHAAACFWNGIGGMLFERGEK